jgi:hypothetical protein
VGCCPTEQVSTCTSPPTPPCVCRHCAAPTGVVSVEEDQVRYPMGRRLTEGDLDALLATSRSLQEAATAEDPVHADALLAPSRKLLQAQQPYGILNVQATQFTMLQRSTTSSVASSRKFPVCIIGELSAVRLARGCFERGCGGEERGGLSAAPDISSSAS